MSDEFTRRPEKVKAFHITAKMLATTEGREVAPGIWTTGGMGYVRVQPTGTTILSFVYEPAWVVWHPDGRINVLTDAAFERDYECRADKSSAVTPTEVDN